MGLRITVGFLSRLGSRIWGTQKGGRGALNHISCAINYWIWRNIRCNSEPIFSHSDVILPTNAHFIIIWFKQRASHVSLHTDTSSFIPSLNSSSWVNVGTFHPVKFKATHELKNGIRRRDAAFVVGEVSREARWRLLRDRHRRWVGALEV